jgi:hypothetical protein
MGGWTPQKSRALATRGRVEAGLQSAGLPAQPIRCARWVGVNPDESEWVLWPRRQRKTGLQFLGPVTWRRRSTALPLRRSG